MTTAVDFLDNESSINRVGKCRVFVRDRWADEWEEVEHLHATEITWSCQPSMPVAALRWDYGRILRPGSNGFETVKKLDWSWPKYAKIVVECQPVDVEFDAWTERKWYGVLQLSIDQPAGVVVTGDDDDPKPLATGTQIVTGFGLEHLLTISPIVSTFFEMTGENYRRQGLRETFNRDGSKNCSIEDLAIGCKAFYYDPDNGQHWNTKEIVRYLLAAAIPEDPDEVVSVPFQIRSGCYFPDWDRPEIGQENASVLSILNRILHRGRLLNWWLEVNEGAGDNGEDVVELVTQTILKEDLPTDLPGNHTIPKSTRQLHLQYDRDTETRATIKDSGLPICDQVLVRGRPLQYVATVQIKKDRAENSLYFAPDWTDAEEESYRSAASGDPNYGALSLMDAQRANHVARAQVSLENVFSRFRLPIDWSQQDFTGAEVFPSYPPMRRRFGYTPYSSLRILPNLPLYYGFDYVENASAIIESPRRPGAPEEPNGAREYLPILLFFRRPDSENVAYVMGQEMGRLAEFGTESSEDIPACSASATVTREGRAIRIRTTGKAQHILAGSSFAKLDVDEYGGVYDYEQAFITLGFENGLCIEHRYPDDVAANVDLVRVHEIRAADHYEMVFIRDQTALDVGNDENGISSIKRNTTGGWIQRPNDGIRQLNALAKIAYSWYSEPHRVVNLETTRLLGPEKITLGDLVVRVGDNLKDNGHAVDCVSPVTEIRVSWPVQDGRGSPPAPTLAIVTSAGELDPLNIQAPPSEDEARGIERRAFERPRPAGGQ